MRDATIEEMIVFERLIDQAKHLAHLAKQVDDYSELVYEASKLEQRIKEYEEKR